MITVKNITVPTKIWSSTAVFKFDNNTKCFLSTKLAPNMISEGSCDTKNQSNDTKINYFLNYIQRKQFLLIVRAFHSITVLRK